ncbi:MAG: hypothetical protein WAK16_09060 [Candidatus Cybelea sp.]
MPKRLMIFLALTALLVAACHSYGSMTPSPSGSPASPAPNPSIKQTVVSVTVNGSPKPKVPIDESTPRSESSPRPGKTIETRDTNRKGFVHFYDLKPSKTYCWVARVGPHVEFSECAGWQVWQTSTITLGT